MVPGYASRVVLLFGDELGHGLVDLLHPLAIGDRIETASQAEDHGCADLLPWLLVSLKKWSLFRTLVRLTLVSVCIISVYRISTLRGAVESQDPPWDNVGAAIWSVIELNCAIICASLPTLRPLVAKVVPGMSSNHSNRATYERYGSKYALGSQSRARARPGFLDSKPSPHSMSTEELALSDMAPPGHGSLPTVYVEAGVHDSSYGLRHNSKSIVVTTETMVRKQ